MFLIMQFNRKYYTMFILLTITIILAFQGDAGLMNVKNYTPLNNRDDVNRITVITTASEINTIDYNTTEQKTEDINLTESKSWIIDKESILGY